MFVGGPVRLCPHPLPNACFSLQNKAVKVVFFFFSGSPDLRILKISPCGPADPVIVINGVIAFLDGLVNDQQGFIHCQVVHDFLP